MSVEWRVSRVACQQTGVSDKWAKMGCDTWGKNHMGKEHVGERARDSRGFAAISTARWSVDAVVSRARVIAVTLCEGGVGGRDVGVYSQTRARTQDAGTQARRHAGTQARKHTGTQAHRHAETGTDTWTRWVNVS